MEESEEVTPEMQEKAEKAIKEFGFNVYDLNEYNYELPMELIAQTPAEKRDESRLLVMNRQTGALEDKPFFQIVDYLHKGDVIVRNNTKVIPARLIGFKDDTHAHVEVLLLNQDKSEKDVWTALCGN